MKNNALTAPGEWDTLCSNTSEVLDSELFARFITIYNQHTTDTTATKRPVTREEVLNDRNLRNRMRAFYREQIEWKLKGAKQAKTVVLISKIVDCAISVLDKRNELLRSSKIEEGNVEVSKLLNERFTL